MKRFLYGLLLTLVVIATIDLAFGIVSMLLRLIILIPILIVFYFVIYPEEKK